MDRFLRNQITTRIASMDVGESWSIPADCLDTAFSSVEDLRLFFFVQNKCELRYSAAMVKIVKYGN